MPFVHLHVHSEYSLLDGACRLKELVKQTKNLGMDAIAVTDHGNMYAAVDFYKLAKKEGIKPIIGCEVYVAPRSRFDRVHELDRESRHLVLLCKNNIGYQNLIQLVSKAWTEGFYNKPRIDCELLEQYHEGLICLSACLAGEIPRLIANRELFKAKETALRYQELFGKGNYYLELQNHGIKEQQFVNAQIIKISKETGIPLVVTNDCHYINREDSFMHKVLLCIQTNHTVDDEDSMEFPTDEFYLKSEAEMRELFPELADAYDNTAVIAEQCNVEFEFGKTKLPHFDVPNNEDHYEYFKRKCYEGLYRNYGDNPDKSLVDRLEYELGTIKRMGYVDYYLIVHDFVSYAKSVSIPVGPGRGSGAGSLAAYCIGITGIDPIKYNLLFERFLNPERVSMPDFDIDFCKDRRQEVIDYVIRKYGDDHVAQIIAFGTMAARGSVRDVGRALGIPYATCDAIAKMIPFEIGMTIDKALGMVTELKKAYDSDEEIHRLIDLARKIEGMPRHATTHAAGVVITEKPVSYYVPLAKNDEATVTQYTMTTLEELGLLKMDFLGLRNLTVIHDAVQVIKKSEPDFDIDRINTADKAVFEMLSQGLSEGVFQFESQGMKSVLSQLKPVNIEDLIAVISLYRPGPMDSIPMYIENRHHPEKITYKHPLLSNILNVTYGCIVYQEQVMQIFRTLAGYSLGRADIVRRAMNKKKKDVMEREHQIFINGLVADDGTVEVDGCLRRGVDIRTATSIYSDMESFASYAFNKSHAAAYAVVAYQTAYLKCHYPREYMSALMTTVLDSSNKLAGYIAECRRIGIDILPPHVNSSYSGFTVSGSNALRFGLLAIRNLGRNIIDEIVNERKNGEYTTFYNFCKRLSRKGMNIRALESLIRSGALDGLDANRRQMMMSAKPIMDGLESDRRRNLDGQLSFFDMGTVDERQYEPELPAVDEFSAADLLAMEKEMTGMYLSGHPMAEFIGSRLEKKCDRISDILEAENDSYSTYRDGTTARLLAIITGIKTKITKNNATMAFVNVEDLSGTLEMLVFPQSYSEYSSLLREGNIVEVLGNISVKEDEEPKILCNMIFTADKNKVQSIAGEKSKAKDTEKVVPSDDIRHAKSSDGDVRLRNPRHLYLRVKSKGCKEHKRALLILDVFDGSTPVSFYYEDTKIYDNLPQSGCVYINKVMLDELKRQLGDENVVLK